VFLFFLLIDLSFGYLLYYLFFFMFIFVLLFIFVLYVSVFVVCCLFLVYEIRHFHVVIRT